MVFGALFPLPGASQLLNFLNFSQNLVKKLLQRTLFLQRNDYKMQKKRRNFGKGIEIFLLIYYYILASGGRHRPFINKRGPEALVGGKPPPRLGKERIETALARG